MKYDLYICSRPNSLGIGIEKNMTKERIVLNSDLRYIDKGNLLRSRSELSIAKMLSFLGQNYEYDVIVTMPDGESVKIDFKAEGGGGSNKYIEVVDSEE